MAARAEKKARTRNRLIDSALAIIGFGANFASISLREVAKTAGVVPTSFYRHFGDMEELGLAMVDELGLNLRRLMRGSFADGESTDKESPDKQSLDAIVRHNADAYFKYVLDNANLVQFVNQSRTGGTKALQDAIRNELQFISGRIATELSVHLQELNPQQRDVTASLIVSALLENTTYLLALPKDSGSMQAELQQRTIEQVHVILLGAASWAAAEKS